VAGAEVTDQLDGASGRIRARTVVNAAGPWVDDILHMEEPATPVRLRLTSGAHVVVPRSRLGHTHGIIFTSPVDGRVVFVLPWGDLSYVGTTETEFQGAPDEVTVSPDEVRYLVRSANALFPNAHLTDEDVVASWAGVRPLLAGDPRTAAAAVSREHTVSKGPGGLVTVAGGKLTTYRRMAAEAVNLAVQVMGEGGRYPSSPTDVEPLPGGEAATWEPFAQAGLDLGLTSATVNHLVRNYGTETAALCNLMRDHRALMEPIHPDHPAVGAEVVHVTRREFAVRVEDVLDRRLHLTTETRDHGVAAAATVARLMGRELGWDDERIRVEEERFRIPRERAAGPPAEG
jgi:glycerol-3-phosphate dehydrogenase